MRVTFSVPVSLSLAVILMAGDIGVDTVKVVVPVRLAGRGALCNVAGFPDWKSEGGGWGASSHWQAFRAPDGRHVTFKGYGRMIYAMCEGSVPKYHGVERPATGAEVVSFSDSLLWQLSEVECADTFFITGEPYLGRVDPVVDVHDPDKLLVPAADDESFHPWPRTKLVKVLYQGDETSFRYNKRRALRVYDKYAECLDLAFFNITRVEVQYRTDWVKRAGLTFVHGRWQDCVTEAVAPIAARLNERAGNTWL